MTDEELLVFPERVRAYPGPYGDVRALMLTSLGTRRLERGDVEGSAAALREAAAVASNGELKGQAGHNARLGELNRIGKLSATDPEAAWAAWQALGPPDPALGATESHVEALIAQNRAIHFSNAGRCADLDALATHARLEHAESLRAACHERHGMTVMAAGNLAGAAEELRVAVRLDPGDLRHRDNLVVMLEKQVDALVHGGRCGEVAPLVAEGRTLAPREGFWDEVTTFCNASSIHR
jgi:hypothetical protein